MTALISFQISTGNSYLPKPEPVALDSFNPANDHAVIVEVPYTWMDQEWEEGSYKRGENSKFDQLSHKLEELQNSGQVDAFSAYEYVTEGTELFIGEDIKSDRGGRSGLFVITPAEGVSVKDLSHKIARIAGEIVSPGSTTMGNRSLSDAFTDLGIVTEWGDNQGFYRADVRVLAVDSNFDHLSDGKPAYRSRALRDDGLQHAIAA